jgi:hypothetical protein
LAQAQAQIEEEKEKEANIANTAKTGGAKAEKPEEGRLCDLFHPRLRRSTVLLWLIWFSFSLGSASFYVLLPSLLKANGFSSADQNAIQFVTNFGGIPGALIACWVLDGVQETAGVGAGR